MGMGSEERKIATKDEDNRFSHCNESHRHGDVHNIHFVDNPKWSHNHMEHRTMSNNPPSRATS